MTRAMFVTVLGRVAGIDAKDYTKVSFDDVVAGSWYTPYVAWASEEGLVLGYGDNRFGVEDQITIEQVVVLLSRYAEYIGIDITTDSVLDGFTDHDMVADWAFEQLKWATYHGIYTGFDGALNLNFLPKDGSLQKCYWHLTWYIVINNSIPR